MYQAVADGSERAAAVAPAPDKIGDLPVRDKLVYTVRAQQKQVALAHMRLHDGRTTNSPRADHTRRILRPCIGRGLLRETGIGLVLCELHDGIPSPARLQLVGPAIAHMEHIGRALRWKPRRGQCCGTHLISAPGDRCPHFGIGARQQVGEPDRIAVGFPGRVRAVREQNPAGYFTVGAAADTIGDAAKSRPLGRRKVAAAILVEQVAAARLGRVGGAQSALPMPCLAQWRGAGLPRDVYGGLVVQAGSSALRRHMRTTGAPVHFSPSRISSPKRQIKRSGNA